MAQTDQLVASPEISWLRARPLLMKWLERSRTNQLQHYKAAVHYSRLNNALGVPTVILTGVVGTTVFASLQKAVNFQTQICVGGISILAAVLAALQTFLRYSERAEKHRSVAATYAGIRKQIEVIGFLPVESRGSLKELLDSLRAQFDALAQSAPPPPESAWEAIRKSKGKTYFLPDWPADEALVPQAPAAAGASADLQLSADPYQDI